MERSRSRREVFPTARARSRLHRRRAFRPASCSLAASTSSPREIKGRDARPIEIAWMEWWMKLRVLGRARRCGVARPSSFFRKPSRHHIEGGDDEQAEDGRDRGGRRGPRRPSGCGSRCRGRGRGSAGTADIMVAMVVMRMGRSRSGPALAMAVKGVEALVLAHLVRRTRPGGSSSSSRSPWSKRTPIMLKRFERLAGDEEAEGRAGDGERQDRRAP